MSLAFDGKEVQMEIKTPWMCMKCCKPVQAYFGGKKTLPCVECDVSDAVTMAIEPDLFGCSPMGLPIRLMFSRYIEVGESGNRLLWKATPCLDPTVDSRLTDALCAEGLGDCFVKPTKPPLNVFYGIDMSKADPMLPKLLGPSPTLAEKIKDTTDKIAENMAMVSWPRWYIEPKRPAISSVWDWKLDFAPDPKTQSTSGDVRGRATKVDTSTGAVIQTSGCRLGCACSVHKPLREPWVPSVDDYDLLPNAV